MTATTQSASATSRAMLSIATALALIVALVYFVIGFGAVPDDFESPPAPAMLLAGVAYLVGGGLIQLGDRRLLLLGAIANTVVLLLFLASAVRGNATIDVLSVSGKAAQVVLGVLLVWLARRARR